VKSNGLIELVKYQKGILLLLHGNSDRIRNLNTQ
jgi:hypothetical protein